MEIDGLNAATRALNGAVVGPTEIAATLGFDPLTVLTPQERRAVSHVPFTAKELDRGRADGDMLILRVPRAPDGPFTMERLASTLSTGLHPSVHKGVGYMLRDEWTIDGQPFATQDAPVAGWWLVRRTPLKATLNKPYGAQDEALAALGPETPDRPRRRNAVEVTYDTLLWREVHGERLLEGAWDWSRSHTADQAFVALGEFGPQGLRVIAYSRAVRFGTLGVCTQR